MPSLTEHRHTLRLHAAFALIILALALLLLLIQDAWWRNFIAIGTLIVDLLATINVFCWWLGCEPRLQFHSVTPILAVPTPAAVCIAAGLPDTQRIAVLVVVASLSALAFLVAVCRVSRFEARHGAELADLEAAERAESAQVQVQVDDVELWNRTPNNVTLAQFKAAHAVAAREESEAQAAAAEAADAAKAGPSAHHHDGKHDGNHDENESDQSEYPALPPAYARDEEERLLGKE